MKFCPACGASLPDDAGFCNHCGQPQGQPQAPQQEQPQAPQQEQPQAPQQEQPQAPQQEQPQAPRYEAPPYEAPQQPGYEAPRYGQQPPAPGSNGWEPMAQPPKKKKKLTWLWIVLGVLVAAAAAVAVWFFCFRKTPEEQLSSAREKTGEKQEELLLTNAKNLKNVKEFVSDYKNAGKVSISLETGGDSVQLDVRSAADLEKKILSYELNLDMNINGRNLPLKIQTAMNEKEMQIALPDLLQDVYSLPMEENDQSSGWVDAYKAMEQGRGVLESLDEYLELREVTEETIEIGGSDRKCQIYTLELNEELKDSIDQLLETAGIGEFPVGSVDYFVEKGLLRGMRMNLTAEGEDHELSMLLEGKKNPAEHITFNMDGKTGAELTFETTDSGFEGKLTIDDEEVIRLVCDDEEKTVDLINDETGKLTIRYDLDGDKASFGLEYDDMELKASIEPEDHVQAEMISDDAIDISKMSDEEAEALGQELVTSLWSNPDTQWIIEEILSLMY